MPRAANQVSTLIARLRGQAPPFQENVVYAPTVDLVDYSSLQARLLSIRDLEPHERGYKFERYLTEMFDNLQAKSS